MDLRELFVDAPFVSVIMPVYNEERYIRSCIESLTNSDYPDDRIEFIVVDGGSDDETAKIVFQLATQDPRIRLLNNPSKTVPYAMNIGIRAARGEYIVRVDAHAEYPPDYVLNSVQTLQRTGADNAGGVWITRPGGKGPMARAIAMALTHPFGVGNAGYRLRNVEGYVDTVPFGSYRRTTFERVGLYQEALTRHQDYELNARIRRNGGGIYLNPDIRCRYFARPNLKALWRQKLLDGKWNAFSWKVCSESMAFRHSFPGLFALLAVTALAFSPISIIARWAFLGGLSLYLGATLMAATQLWHRERDASAILTPLVFPVLHFGHGFGLINGFLQVGAWVDKEWRYQQAPMLELIPDRVVVREAA